MIWLDGNGWQALKGALVKWWQKPGWLLVLAYVVFEVAGHVLSIPVTQQMAERFNSGASSFASPISYIEDIIGYLSFAALVGAWMTLLVAINKQYEFHGGLPLQSLRNRFRTMLLPSVAVAVLMAVDNSINEAISSFIMSKVYMDSFPTGSYEYVQIAGHGLGMFFLLMLACLVFLAVGNIFIAALPVALDTAVSILMIPVGAFIFSNPDLLGLLIGGEMLSGDFLTLGAFQYLPAVLLLIMLMVFAASNNRRGTGAVFLFVACLSTVTNLMYSFLLLLGMLPYDILFELESSSYTVFRGKFFGISHYESDPILYLGDGVSISLTWFQVNLVQLPYYFHYSTMVVLNVLFCMAVYIFVIRWVMPRMARAMAKVETDTAAVNVEQPS